MRIDAAKTLNPGLLREQLIVQYKNVTGQDSYGQDVYTWQTFVSMKGQVTALQGRELELAQQKWAEALGYIERASTRFWLVDGIHAGILLRLGELDHAGELTRKLASGGAAASSLGLAWCYAVAGDFDRSADFVEKAAARRQPEAAHHGYMLLRDWTRWPALAKLMNLPENPAP